MKAVTGKLSATCRWAAIMCRKSRPTPHILSAMQNTLLPFEYAGQDTETVRITVNEGEAITNDIIYGSVSGKKSDEDGKALGSAVIGIFKTGTTEFTKENAICSYHIKR